ncbi:DUF2271 domain-containing protein [Paracidovorax wautersii]|uniref:DUF2271 domain-containing protein n=1 Tax=Paracidovorax wautersii TaxID=1177982 RepID=A0ABU1IFW3_9BURK|nr:hypothetical protein [Paracidovorax wautersii]
MKHAPMQQPMALRTTVALGACLGAPAFAAGLGVGVEIPRLDVAEYHRPYVAIWVERADATVASTLAVWYDVKLKNDEGAKWLKDMRQWWRRTGRELALPIDGVTGATRPAGRHQVQFTEGTNPFAQLPAGHYKLVVEAAREVGGRELVTIPFSWPAAKGEQLRAKGHSELGEVTLDLKP